MVTVLDNIITKVREYWFNIFSSRENLVNTLCPTQAIRLTNFLPAAAS